MEHHKKLVLVRIADTGKETLGHLFLFSDLDLIFKCVVLEPPWKGNATGISCIPKGEYTVRPRSGSESPKFKYDHLFIGGTGDRECILIHRGNFNTNTRGCLLVGRGFSDINHDGNPDVFDSTATLDLLAQFIREEIPLEIV